jgi:hypothetical protein
MVPRAPSTVAPPPVLRPDWETLAPCRLHPPISFVAQPTNRGPLGFEAEKPRNRSGDFEAQITKP